MSHEEGHALASASATVHRDEEGDPQLIQAFVRDGLRLLVENNGNGFNPSKEDGGLGLRSMKYRLELLRRTFSLDSAPGEGARIKCRVCPPMHQRP